MTKQEFTELTGINPTEDEFDKIHDLYMATGAEMDKQSFCAAYKSCKDMTLVNALYHSLTSSIHSLASSINSLKEERDSIEKERKEDRKKFEDLWLSATNASEDILRVAHEFPSDNIVALANKAAVTLIGQSNVWKIKLREGFSMGREERLRFCDEITVMKGQIAEYRITGKIEGLDRERENE